MKCPSCGKVIDESRFTADLTYCPHCGQDIKAAGDASRLQFCPYCGQKLTTQTNFCPQCGKKLTLEKPSAERTICRTSIAFIERTTKPIAKAIRSTFGRERKIRKLYEQWAEFSSLPPEEIPSMDDLKDKSSEKKERDQDSSQGA
jgi:predicted amidophosphoribosyltransferase